MSVHLCPLAIVVRAHHVLMLWAEFKGASSDFEVHTPAAMYIMCS